MIFVQHRSRRVQHSIAANQSEPSRSVAKSTARPAGACGGGGGESLRGVLTAWRTDGPMERRGSLAVVLLFAGQHF